MSWQLAIALSTIAGAVRILFMRRFSLQSKLPTKIPPATAYLFGVMPVGLIAGIFVFPHHINWSAWVVFLMAVLSISMALSNWLGFSVASKISVAPQQTISISTNLLVIVLGWALLSERLTVWQSIGGAILLAAAFIAAYAPAKTRTGDFKHNNPKTIGIAFLAAVLLAIGLVTEKALLGHMQIGGIFLVSWTAQCFGMLLLASKDIVRSRALFTRQDMLWPIALGVANGLNGAFYIYAIFHSNNISLISVINAVGLPLTVLGAYVFLREREHHLLMWLSITLSFAGLLVMAIH